MKPIKINNIGKEEAQSSCLGFLGLLKDERKVQTRKMAPMAASTRARASGPRLDVCICDLDAFTRVDSFERVYVAPQGQRNLTGRKTDVAKSERTHVEALCAFTLLVYDVKEDRCRFWSHWLDRI